MDQATKSGETHAIAAQRRIDMLLRGVMIPMFVAGAVAIAILWSVEARYGLLDDVGRYAYPAMLTSFVGSTLMLRRWPRSVAIARWIGFAAITGFLFAELVVAMWDEHPLVGHYPFISLLMWLPLAYAVALFMLEARHAPWAAVAQFALIAVASFAHLRHATSADPNDTALLVNLLASHVVLLACLGGLVKFKQVLFKADAQSRRLFEQASTDPLTGLANRRCGLDRLHAAAPESGDGTLSAVILCDLDHFKAINDRYGHATGDQLVIAVAAILASSTRDVDTVVRWGGDEFLIVVPHIGQATLRELAERLRARIAESAVRVRGGAAGATPSIALSASLGVAEKAAGESIEAWIRRADEALYVAKAGGRNRCAFAHPADAGATVAATTPAWAFDHE